MHQVVTGSGKPGRWYNDWVQERDGKPFAYIIEVQSRLKFSLRAWLQQHDVGRCCALEQDFAMSAAGFGLRSFCQRSSHKFPYLPHSSRKGQRDLLEAWLWWLRMLNVCCTNIAKMLLLSSPFCRCRGDFWVLWQLLSFEGRRQEAYN